MPNNAPFLRWAGGKSWLTKHLDTITCGREFDHYHEPFLGGGAVFFSLEHRLRSYLSDANSDLIDTYIAIKTQPEDVITFLQSLNNTAEDYYRIRTTHYDELFQKAAQFIYLNQTSFNGLYRVNRSGQYNVPYGNRTNYQYDFQRIRAASVALKNTNISCGDFEVNKNKLKPNDLVFLDPPYTVSHNNNGFIEYNRNLFSLQDQYRLSKYIDHIKRKGAYYILTNAAHTTIEDIFTKDDHMLRLERYSLIGGKAAKRERIEEFIFTNIPRGVEG